MGFSCISHLVDRHIDEISKPGKSPETVVVVLHGCGHCVNDCTNQINTRAHHTPPVTLTYHGRHQRVPLEDTVPLRSVPLPQRNMIVRTQRFHYNSDDAVDDGSWNAAPLRSAPANSLAGIQGRIYKWHDQLHVICWTVDLHGSSPHTYLLGYLLLNYLRCYTRMDS